MGKPLRGRIVPPIAVVAEIPGNDDDSGRISAPKATTIVFPESIRPLRWSE
ncbi:hypothetical protein ABES58_14630 [Paenibacillus lautus]|uniref:hypothetical protein n=1 Tax=Paenibacillus lautus TaxID=1401 RepID=UPI003D2A36C6